MNEITYPCCEHCVNDPTWHTDHPPGTHVVSCSICDERANTIGSLTDDALIEEAARRGMSVMDAAEAARLRGTAEGVEKLADEWEADARFHADTEHKARIESGYGRGECDTEQRMSDDHAAALRALLHVDIESEAGA